MDHWQSQDVDELGGNDKVGAQADGPGVKKKRRTTCIVLVYVSFDDLPVE